MNARHVVQFADLLENVTRGDGVIMIDEITPAGRYALADCLLSGLVPIDVVAGERVLHDGVTEPQRACRARRTDGGGLEQQAAAVGCHDRQGVRLARTW